MSADTATLGQKKIEYSSLLSTMLNTSSKAVSDKARTSNRLLDIDLASKVLIIVSSVYWISSASPADVNSQEDKIFIR